MNLLKTIMVGCLWWIGIVVVFALIQVDGGAAVRGSAGPLAILLIAGVLYMILAGVKKLTGR
jgi:hypothetical protein